MSREVLWRTVRAILPELGISTPQDPRAEFHRKSAPIRAVLRFIGLIALGACVTVIAASAGVGELLFHAQRRQLALRRLLGQSSVRAWGAVARPMLVAIFLGVVVGTVGARPLLLRALPPDTAPPPVWLVFACLGTGVLLASVTVGVLARPMLIRDTNLRAEVSA